MRAGDSQAKESMAPSRDHAWGNGRADEYLLPVCPAKKNSLPKGANKNPLTRKQCKNIGKLKISNKISNTRSLWQNKRQ